MSASYISLPEGIKCLIKDFARGWQPTPSASALRKAIRKERGKVSFFDKHATARCQVCNATVRCARWWQIHDDGSVYMLYHEPSAHCNDCRSPYWEDEVVEVEVCQTLSRKSTWETSWENSTGEYYHPFREKDLRMYVKSLSPQ